MRRGLIGTAAAALALAALAVAPGAASGEAAGPGAAGVGDRYFPTDGNGGYDVGHYDLDVDYQPSSHVLTGRATLTARATQALSRFDLDLTGLHVDAVRVDGQAAGWTRKGQHELVITPQGALADGDDFEVVVAYHGKPGPLHENGTLGANGFFQTEDGSYVEGEPHLASTWFPANDHPTDKATYDVAIRVPRGLQAISNGRLVSHDSAAGRTTWRWSETAPMAPYLVTATTGHFRLTQYRSGGIDYVDAIDPALPAAWQRHARAALSEEPRILAWLSTLYGPYPFAQAGGIVDDDRGLPSFSMEIQTRPIYQSSEFKKARADNDSILVHELSHQWTGDSLSVAGWRDIWLNEGFAEYAEWMWSEHEGRDTAQQLFDEVYGTEASAGLWRVKPAEPGRTRLFADAVYDRGAMTLHVLRQRIGDHDFFELLRRWTQEHRYGNVTTSQFVALAEQVSGQDLDALFHTWLYSAGKPRLTS